MPKRIQRKRAKGWRMPEGTVSVTRPGPFGNPWTIERAITDAEIFEGYPLDRHWAHEKAVLNFRAWIEGEIDGRKAPVAEEFRQEYLRRIPELRGKDLACWCRLDQPCHADVLLELANA